MGIEFSSTLTNQGHHLMSRLLRRTYPTPFHAHCFILCALLVAFPTFTHGQTTWDGSEADDNWFNANNWDTGIVPNGITEDAIVDAPSPTFYNSAVSLNSLTVEADGILNANWHMTFGGTATTTLDNMGTITVGPGADFQLSAQANNSGSIQLNSTGSPADLRVVSNGATLSDGGTITFNHPNARIEGLSGATLTIADQTLQGFGQIGSNSVELINSADGFIDANSAGNTLTIDTSTAGGVNQGTMQASAGGILRINGSNLDNTGSSIQALAGSTVELSGDSSLTGGTLSGAGTFNVVAGQFAGLTDLTHSGAMNVSNNGHLRLTGNINNTGGISVNSTGQVADLQIQAAGATLAGGGTVTLTHPSSQINGAAGATLTIADQTLQGYGNIGVNSVELNNSAGGLIDANSAGNTLTVDTSSTGGVNQGIMRASAGGILRINGSNIVPTPVLLHSGLGRIHGGILRRLGRHGRNALGSWNVQSRFWSAWYPDRSHAFWHDRSQQQLPPGIGGYDQQHGQHLRQQHLAGSRFADSSDGGNADRRWDDHA